MTVSFLVDQLIQLCKNTYDKIKGWLRQTRDIPKDYKPIMKILALLAGGAIGTLLRYSVSGWTYKYFEEVFPWGTLFVNLLSAFTVGFLWELSERWVVSPNMRAFVFIGILGGFSTFSTYVLETINLAREGETALAISNIIISNTFGLMLVYLGLITARYLIKIF